MSSFFRKRVRGLLKSTFSVPGPGRFSSEDDDMIDENELPISLNGVREGGGGGCEADLPPRSSSALIYERILNGKRSHGRRTGGGTPPEVYSGKTGLDLPMIHVDKLSPLVKACYTGPDGGLCEVQQMRQEKVARMANLDDEFSLSSFDGDDSDEGVSSGGTKKLKVPKATQRANSMEALGFTEDDLVLPGSSTVGYDWTLWDDERAFGLSTSLYEKNPITGLNAGSPIADVFGIIARENNAILALADGVNWGEGARLAARCAIRGAIDYLNASVTRSAFETTKDVFHCLLGAFHASHALILQEGGALTTLCVAIVVPVKNSSSYALCVCNVGDSLCFVYSPNYGVIEVTQASHDIGVMRDMRDAGGALGPVDGRNPQLHNLTCSMTFLEEGDFVFITSDGVSDNFDPVVGKFCTIKKTEELSRGPSEDHADIDPFLGPQKTKSPHQSQQNPSMISSRSGANTPSSIHKTKSAPVNNVIANNNTNAKLTTTNGITGGEGHHTRKAPMATLPCVDSFERHELMLLRMADVIANGLEGCSRFNKGVAPREQQHPINSITPSSGDDSSNSEAGGGRLMITASDLCKRLVQFSYQLSSAKRRTLEDPELYRMRTHSKTEERLRRKMMRSMIMEMAGKLDHATVVAYRLGKWEDEGRGSDEVTNPSNYSNGISLKNGHLTNGDNERPSNCVEHEENGYYEIVEANSNSNYVSCPHPQKPHCIEQLDLQQLGQGKANVEDTKRRLNLEILKAANGNLIQNVSSPSESPIKSPYEEISAIGFNNENGAVRNTIDQQTIGVNRIRPSSKKRHSRGSTARHTLGVDVTWLKRLVSNRSTDEEDKNEDSSPRKIPARNNDDEYNVSQLADEQNVDGSAAFSKESMVIRMPVTNANFSPNGIVNGGGNGNRESNFERNNSNNFSLKRLKAFIKQTRIIAGTPSNTARPSPSASTPPLPRGSVPVLGISGLMKTTPLSSAIRPPASTRV